MRHALDIFREILGCPGCKQHDLGAADWIATRVDYPPFVRDSVFEDEIVFPGFLPEVDLFDNLKREVERADFDLVGFGLESLQGVRPINTTVR
jgi:hypothetical protein